MPGTIWIYCYGFSLKWEATGVSDALCYEAKIRDQPGAVEALVGRAMYFDYWNNCGKILSCEPGDPGVLLLRVRRPDNYAQEDPTPCDGRYKVY